MVGSFLVSVFSSLFVFMFFFDKGELIVFYHNNLHTDSYSSPSQHVPIVLYASPIFHSFQFDLSFK